MKKLIVIPAIVSMLTWCSFAQPNIFPVKPWHATVTVLGDDKQPVANAKVIVYYTIPPMAFPDDSGKYSGKIEGQTDTNGIFLAEHVDRTGSVDFEINKDGFYQNRKACTLRDPIENANDRDIFLTLTLKKISKPVAMYSKKYAMALKLPEYGKLIGYDLMIGDWVGLYGNGVSTDLFFEQDYTNAPSGGYYSKITIAFPKVGDGIQLYDIPDSETGSGLRSPHTAPTDGYQSKLARETSALHGQPSKFEFDPKRIYLFRVRTVKDHEGNIVSAHYGKIYGDFMQFSYYFNPTPNDRNIEFAPNQNLLGGLQSFEQVNQP